MANENDKIKLPDEQLNLLAASFLPVIRKFYKTEQGKKLWEEHLKEQEAEKKEKEGAD
ncbi:MAG: hypothetical protein J1F11_05570 [Oscillospiraceae bacterium]|nr:hypothetical protein [Oscillospiraceae bacterium]